MEQETKKGERAVKPKSVFDYSAVRWLEKHHKQKKVSRQMLDEDKINQLKEMFDHLDEDGSGCIEVCELELAMKFLGLEHGQDKILEQFKYMDADGSGSIDFEEFVTVMTSDLVDQEFFQLQDEKEAAKWDLAFFQFATNFRRQKLIDDIAGKTILSQLPDRYRYQKFETLFGIPVLPNSLQDEGAERISLEAQKRADARKIELQRYKKAKESFLRDRRDYLKSQYGEKFLRGGQVPFQVFDNSVPRQSLGTFESDGWKPNRNDQRRQVESTVGWDHIRFRTVRKDGWIKQQAIRQAKQVIGSQNQYTLRKSKKEGLLSGAIKDERKNNTRISNQNYSFLTR